MLAGVTFGLGMVGSFGVLVVVVWSALGQLRMRSMAAARSAMRS
jgi:hypothetical protein